MKSCPDRHAHTPHRHREHETGERHVFERSGRVVVPVCAVSVRTALDREVSELNSAHIARGHIVSYRLRGREWVGDTEAVN